MFEQHEAIEMEKNPYNFIFKPVILGKEILSDIEKLYKLTGKKIKIYYPHLDLISWLFLHNLIYNPKCGFKNTFDNRIIYKGYDEEVEEIEDFTLCFFCEAHEQFITKDKSLEKQFKDFGMMNITSQLNGICGYDYLHYYTQDIILLSKNICYDNSGRGLPNWISAFLSLYNCNFKTSLDIRPGTYDFKDLFNKLNDVSLKTGFKYSCGGCPKNCNYCDIKDKQKCFECKKNYDFIDKSCVFCGANCNKCRLDDNSKNTICLECDQGLLINGKCEKATKCPNGHFITEKACCPLRTNIRNGVCVPCQKYCLKCKFTQSSKDIFTETCTECMEQYQIQGALCLRPCEPGNFFDRQDCLRCKQKYCDFCRGTGDQDCFQCFKGFIYQKIDDGTMQCVKCTNDLNCGEDDYCKESGYYIDSEYPFTCKQCKQNCISCSNGEDCQKCQNGYFLLNQNCIGIIEQKGKYLDKKSNLYKSCHFSCSQCEDSSKLCIQCSELSKYYIEEKYDSILIPYSFNQIYFDKKFCFDLCPQNYEKINNLNSNQESFKCVLKPQKQDKAYSYSFIQECSPSQFKQDGKCFGCPENCLSCINSEICLECIDGFQWNSISQKCQLCNIFCKNCKNSLFTNCSSCKDTSLNIPSIEDKCKFTDIKQNIKNLSLLLRKDILQNISSNENIFVKQNDAYSVNFSVIYNVEDRKWRQMKFLPDNDQSCNFQQFQTRYSSNQFESKTCKPYQIKQSQLTDDGHLSILFSMILAKFSVKVKGELVNPKILINQAQIQNAISTSYQYTLKSEFGCDQLKCMSKVNIGQLSFDQGKNKIKLKAKSKINFASQGQDYLCSNNQMVQSDEMQLANFEEFVSASKKKNSSEINKFFIINVCGLLTKQNKIKMLPFLVMTQLGQGMYEVSSSTDITDQKQFTLFSSGADVEMNNYFVSKYPGYKNPFSWYNVIGVSIYEVQSQESNVNISKQYFEQFVQNVDNFINSSTISYPVSGKQFKCRQLFDFIKTNDLQGNLFITKFTEKKKIISQFITEEIILPLLSDFKITVQDFLNLDTIPQQNLSNKIFQKYIEQVSTKTHNCYPISQIFPCIQNVFIDIVYSNNGICIEKAKFSELMTQKDYQGLGKLLRQSEWCNNNKRRCDRSFQIISTYK